MDFSKLITKKSELVKDLELKIIKPEIYSDPKKSKSIMQEIKRTKDLLKNWNDYQACKKGLEDNKKLIDTEEDEEFLSMINQEITESEKKIIQYEQEIQYGLLPKNEAEFKDAIIEIRAGTGGDEASIFAADLSRMYIRYAENKNWKVENIELGTSEVGGTKNAVFKIKGEEVFRFLKYESGVHRVQRVPTTETQGRIHTSTATVAILPEAEEVDIELKTEDLRIEACRAGGPGGQHVNTTDSAVQILHIPSGILVRCQEGRSQGKNKEKAMSILRAKLLEKTIREEAEKYSEQRRNLIGSAGREEKIRTYNFPQNRVTDHRIKKTMYNLDQFIDGNIDSIIESLQKSEIDERINELMEAK